jgi:hypothetical protein
MANRGLFTILIVFVGLGILFAGGVNVGYEQSWPETEVTNESITVDYSAPVAVQSQPDPVRYNDTVTIENATGDVLTAGTDYAWNETSGEVTWFDTNATTDGETAYIDYQYYTPTESQAAGGGLMQIGGIGLVLLLFLLVGQWVFDVVGDW